MLYEFFLGYGISPAFLGGKKKERIPSVILAYLSGNTNDDILHLHTKNVRTVMSKRN